MSKPTWPGTDPYLQGYWHAVWRERRKPLDDYRIVTKQREPGYQQGERLRVCRYCERPPMKVDDIVTRAWV